MTVGLCQIFWYSTSSQYTRAHGISCDFVHLEGNNG